MKIFIPISDEMLERGEFPDELVAYQPGQTPLSQLQAIPTPVQSSSTVSTSPKPTPSPAAAPALSSSTYIAGATLG